MTKHPIPLKSLDSAASRLRSGNMTKRTRRARIFDSALGNNGETIPTENRARIGPIAFEHWRTRRLIALQAAQKCFLENLNNGETISGTVELKFWLDAIAECAERIRNLPASHIPERKK